MSVAAALVVHDLKNELGALEAGLEQLVRQARQPEAAAADAAHRQCQRLRQRLVMYLTLYGGAELQAHCEDEAPLDLITGLAARHGEPVVVAADIAAPPFWHYDRRLVAMALDAALHNALRFARRRVELGLRVEGKQLLFSVDDDGPGLGMANPAEHGTGLGTMLCRAVAQAHGGEVRLFNREGSSPGGARFELRLAT